MKIGDTVRDPKSGITGTVTDIVGHHIMVKSDDYGIPIMLYDYELVKCEPVKEESK